MVLAVVKPLITLIYSDIRDLSCKLAIDSNLTPGALYHSYGLCGMGITLVWQMHTIPMQYKPIIQVLESGSSHSPDLMCLVHVFFFVVVHHDFMLSSATY